MTQELCDFFAQCPHLAGRTLNTNCLGSGIGDCSVDSTENTETLKTYADGGRLCRAEFIFASRESCSASRTDNAAADSLYEKISAWLDSKNRAGELPQLKDGAEAVGICAGGRHTVKSRGGLDARYEIKIDLIYFYNPAE